MNIGESIRIPIRSVCNAYYLRWYFNGWHYWAFLPGTENHITSGQNYRTYGSKRISLSSGNVTYDECQAIRTIRNTREVYILADVGWKSLRVEPGSIQVYDSKIGGYEIELSAIVGSRMLSYTGYSPVTTIPTYVVNPPDTWGNYYNWFAINNVHGIAPDGYHVPSKTECDTLMNYVGGFMIAGGHLKTSGTDYWETSITGQDDSVGFGIRGNGRRNYDGNQDWDLKTGATLWASDDLDETNAWAFCSMTDGTNIFQRGSSNKHFGMGLRFIKDNSTNENIMTDYDGFVYPTIAIGTQVWTARNFCCTHYKDGTPIPYLHAVSDWANDTEGAYSFYEEK